MDIFERAARDKTRFPSPIGPLTAEQLFDLPITGRGNGATLSAVYNLVQAELKELGEGDDFIDTKPNPRRHDLELQIEILRHVRDVIVAQRDAEKKRAENAELKRRLLAIKADKQDEALKGLSEEEINKRLAELA